MSMRRGTAPLVHALASTRAIRRKRAGGRKAGLPGEEEIAQALMSTKHEDGSDLFWRATYIGKPEAARLMARAVLRLIGRETPEGVDA